LKLQHSSRARNNVIAYCLTLACIIVLTLNVATAQSAKVKSAMADLKAMAGTLGSPTLQGSDLYFGSDKADHSIVDAVVNKDGGAATLFVKNGDQLVRVASTIQKEDGTSAVGTALDPQSPAFAKLGAGEPYYGEVTVFGKTYDAGYEPIQDASGVIGAYFVGYPK
jgi:cache 3/cache 2 fusion protein